MRWLVVYEVTYLETPGCMVLSPPPASLFRPLSGFVGIWKPGVNSFVTPSPQIKILVQFGFEGMLPGIPFACPLQARVLGFVILETACDTFLGCIPFL